jgi:predicted GTPase
LQKSIYNVVVLGNTGVGKSSLLNMLAGQDVFRVGEGAMSETSLTKASVHRLFDNNSAIQLRLIDTQGLSDSGGNAKDMEHIKNMVESIKKEQFVDLFIICFDGTSPRFSAYAQSTVKLFQQIFPEFWRHTVLVFNKWTSPDVNRMNNLRAEYQVIFKRDFKVDQIPCYFIDSFFNRAMLRDNADGTQSVRQLHPNIMQRTQSEVNDMISHLTSKSNACDVRTIEPKDTEQERLVKERQEAQLRLQRQQEESRRFAEQQRLENERRIAEQQAAHAAAVRAAQEAAARAAANQPKKKKWYKKIFG